LRRELNITNLKTKRIATLYGLGCLSGRIFGTCEALESNPSTTKTGRIKEHAINAELGCYQSMDGI
jgi:hypothetical protein